MNPEQFVKDRHEAFASMDKQKIKAYCRKYGMSTRFPRDEKIWKGGINKAILECTDFSDEEKKKALVWLLLNGYQQDGTGRPLHERFGYLLSPDGKKEQ
jgi:hypothetical protein